MKKYLVIGNPIEHSLSPKLHNYWFEKNNIDANYSKRKIDKNKIQEVISEIRDKKLDGINVTVPFKSDVIPFLDTLSEESKITQSVNTIYKHDDKLIGHNTDIKGFELSLNETQFNPKNKTVFILGAGGVVPSIIYALEKLGVSKIIVSNRTKQKAENLKKYFSNITVVDWGDQPEFDMIINATSLGLDKEDDTTPSVVGGQFSHPAVATTVVSEPGAGVPAFQGNLFGGRVPAWLSWAPASIVR